MKERSRATMAAFAVALACVLAVCAGCGCGKEDAGTTAKASPPQLNVGHVGHDHQLALYVAALEGERFKKDYGIYLKEVKPEEVYDLVDGDRTLARLRLIKVGGGSKMPAAMTRGDIDLGLGGVAAVAKFADEGQPFKIICPLQTDGDMLVVQPDLAASDWASFIDAVRASNQPLKIGYKAPTAVAKLIFERALAEEGITYGLDETAGTQVVLVNFGSENSPIPLLESRSLDGFVMNQPAVAVAVDKGVGKVIADLRDLPPEGKWHNHPCCCVAVPEATLTTHPEVVKAFIKLIALSTELMKNDQGLAVDCASRWTKYSTAVEQASVPTIVYGAEPTESWLAGMRTWSEMAKDIKQFKGRYADMPPAEFVDDVCDLTLCNEAIAELRQKGLIK